MATVLQTVQIAVWMLNNAVSAKIKGTDEENDLAVIAVEKSDIPEADDE